MDFKKVYTKYSDTIPLNNKYNITRKEKKNYDLGFFDACEKINELLKDLPKECKEQIEKALDH